MHVKNTLPASLALCSLTASTWASVIGDPVLQGQFDRRDNVFAEADFPDKVKRNTFPYPNLQGCQAAITPAPSDRALFYTGLSQMPNYAGWQAMGDLQTNHRLEDVALAYPFGFVTPDPNGNGGTAAYQTFADQFSQVFADTAQGLAWLIKPSTCGVWANSVWDRIEYPHLTSNPSVTAIVSVAADNLAISSTIWTRPAAAAAATPSAAHPPKDKRDSQPACPSSPPIPPSLLSSAVSKSATPASSTAASQPPSTGTAGKAGTVVQVSENSVSVGALAGKDLYNGMWTALKGQCQDVPAPKGCNDNQVTVPNVPTLIGTQQEEGEITLIIKDSSYTTNGQRDAMMGAAIQAVVQGATGNNCKSMPWTEMTDDPQNCAKPSKEKRNALAINGGPHPKRLFEPETTGQCTGHTTLCGAPDLITVEYNAANEPEAAHFNMEIGFQLEGGNSAFAEFVCDIVIETVEGALTAAAPEVAPADWALMGEILPCCADQCVGDNVAEDLKSNHKRSLNGTAFA